MTREEVIAAMEEAERRGDKEARATLKRRYHGLLYGMTGDEFRVYINKQTAND